ncbi:MAG: hypothetical protein WC897_05925 [Candidatus Gracilibacteria bacterium]
MASVDPTLKIILAEMKKISGKVSKVETRLSVIEKSVSGIEKDMKKVLKCVATENADDFPLVKHNRSASKLGVAAKSR